MKLTKKQKAEGWIEWNGGVCPVPEGAPTEVMLRNGFSGSDEAPELWGWNHIGKVGDIIAYRVHPSQPQEPTMTPEQKIADLEKQLAELKAEIAKPKGRWKPSDKRDTYHIISGYGTIDRLVWEGDDADKANHTLGNVYPTDEAAEQVAENRRVHCELIDLTNGFVPDWEDKREIKYCLQYDHESAEIRWKNSCQQGQFPNTVYFPMMTGDIPTIEKTIGRERLIKYLTGSVI